MDKIRIWFLSENSVALNLLIHPCFPTFKRLVRGIQHVYTPKYPIVG